MKDIKFRIWWGDDKEMGEVFDLYQLLLDVNGYSDFNKKCVLLQWTGLKDKNEKEIYAGDILLIGDDDLDQDYDEAKDEYTDKVKVTVIWCGAIGYPAFDIKPNPYEDTNGLSQLEATGRMQVIGNIYENADLLNGQSNLTLNNGASGDTRRPPMNEISG